MAMKKTIICILLLLSLSVYSQQFIIPIDGIYEVQWMTINNQKMDIPLMVLGVEKETATVVVMTDINRNMTLDDDTVKYYDGIWNNNGYISFDFQNAHHIFWCAIDNGSRNYYWKTELPGQEVFCQLIFKGQWSW